ncbi:tyrosine-protein phosphatase non-receptor type 23 [Onthophagus taurus]|uniref:tyrosine-protein phosphatase non-receptor type 23 n=1 Tax=Onthophagus taurus TaxID=166361 RepID=UPI0039BE7DF8
MEAAPRLPMISFPFKQSTENVSFAQQLKPYIANFYHEDPESYSTEFNRLESLRNSSMFPQQSINSLQSQKRYYAQLSFLKSRFPMHEGQPCAVIFSWKDPYSNASCAVADIKFEMMCVLYNIAALHTQLGSESPRSSSEEMKIVCTHFQYAAWCFQTLRDNYSTMLSYHDAVEITHAMQLICFAQAQECILEKSMLDNRKATIIAKVAMQVVDYYKQAFAAMQTLREDADGLKITKYTLKYLAFKCEYHRAIALLYMGQQSEEQQKMGERVAFYQASLEHHEEARKYASSMSSSQVAPFKEALTFTLDVIEGKRKAAKNENEFIYHEEVPNRDVLQEIKGASLVKGIPFNINDPEISGPDIFARLVPMQAHEASSLYSEQKAQLMRRMGELIEIKDQALAEFMSSLQLEVLNQIHQCKGLPQDIIDRAAALSARNTICQDLSAVMTKLSGSFIDVEAMLRDIQELLKEEESKEKEYQSLMGKRPPSIIATDLSREAAKYQEAHNKASDSNQNLHRAMMAHVTNIKLLAMPLQQLQQQIPSIELPNPNIDEKQLREIQMLLGKVEEMKSQRIMLWNQFREGIHKDDITGILVTKKSSEKLDDIFTKELMKHKTASELIEKNVGAQDNIAKALVEAYAQFTSARKYIQDVTTKRSTFITNLIASYDAIDDLLSKANKGIEFYNKLETNVSKLFQRIKSACKVQDEEREQILLKNKEVKPEPVISAGLTTTRGPKLKDYLDNMKGDKLSVKMDNFNPVYAVGSDSLWPPGVRPTPVGSEITTTASSNTYVGGERVDYSQLAYGSSSQTNSVYTYSAGYNQPITNPGQGYNSDYTQNMSYGTTVVSGNNPAMTQYYQGMNNTGGNNMVDSSNYGGYSGYGYQEAASQGGVNYTQQGMNFNQGYGGGYNNMGYDQNLPGNTPNISGTNQNPSGSNQNLSGVNQDPSAFSQNQSGFNPNPSGLSQNPSGYTQNPTLSNQNSVGSIANPTGIVQNPTGIVQNPTGTIQQPIPITPNSSGTIQNTTTHIQQPIGVPPNSTGILQNPTGMIQNLAAPLQSPSTNIPNQNTIYHGEYVPQSVHQGYSTEPTQSLTRTSMATWQNLPTISNSYTSTGSQQNAYETYSTPDNNLDDILSERMAALLAKNKQTPKPQGANVNYSQYDYVGYGENYQPGFVGTDQASISGSVHSAQSATSYWGEQQSGVVSQVSQPQIVQTSQPQTSFSDSAYGSQSTFNYLDQNKFSSGNPDEYQQYYPNQPNLQYYDYSQQGYSGQNYYNYPNYSTANYQTVPTASTVPQTLQPTHSNTSATTKDVAKNSISPKKESSIDLLSGLDFNISQAPLVPQTEIKKEEKPQEVVAKPSTIENTNPPKMPVKTESDVVNKIKKKLERPKTDPFQNVGVVATFLQEVDKFEKFCDTLFTKTLNGPTNLDLKWKEIHDRQENEIYNKSISIARCYPLKNRFADILPYDYSRVELKTTVDDYINASYVKDSSQNCPIFIVTQAPTQTTIADFWAMVFEQEIDIAICLLNNNEIENDGYWPKETGKDIFIANKVISLVSTVTKDHWVERRITVSLPEKRKFKTLVHLQFTAWSGSVFSTTPVPFVNFVKETLTICDQMDVCYPILVHCSAGIGRSGLFCVLMAAILEVMINPSVLPDIPLISGKMSCKRRNILRDREHLKFCYTAFLYYLKELQTRYKPETSGHSRKASTSSLNIPPVVDDPFSSLDPLWATKKK